MLTAHCAKPNDLLMNPLQDSDNSLNPKPQNSKIRIRVSKGTLQNLTSGSLNGDLFFSEGLYPQGSP